MAVTLNASTSTGYIQSADTSGNLELQSNGTTQFNVTATGAYGQLKSGTSVTASGTSVDFTGIPSWVKRITVMFNGVSLSATADLLVQIGDSGGIETTGYVSGSGSGSNSTSGYVVRMANAARAAYGVMQITNITGNNWVSFHSINAGTTADFAGGGGKTLSDVLTQLRITSTSTDTFDAGTINILYEG